MITFILLAALLALYPFFMELLKTVGLIGLYILRFICIYGLTIGLLIWAVKG